MFFSKKKDKSIENSRDDINKNDNIITTEKELYNCVNNATKNGIKTANRSSRIINLFILVVVVFIVTGSIKGYIKNEIVSKINTIMQQFEIVNGADSHDMVLENNGILGYTAADFEEAILGDTSQLKIIEVYDAEVSDAVVLNEAGLANLKIFSKSQVITYHGIATYIVDLSNLDKSNIAYNEKEKTLKLLIPHTVQKDINIPSDEMEFSDTERGWLAFGEIKLTAQQLAEVEKEAQNKMEQKLRELGSSEVADRFAVMSVWEIYQPLVTAVSPEIKLEVDFE